MVRLSKPLPTGHELFWSPCSCVWSHTFCKFLWIWWFWWTWQTWQHGMVHVFLKRCFAQRNPSRWQMWQSVHTFFTCGPWDQLSETLETQWNTSHILFTVPPFTSLPQSATVSNFFHRLFTLQLRCSAILLITTVSWASSCCLMTFRCRSSSLTSAWRNGHIFRAAAAKTWQGTDKLKKDTGTGIL